MPDWFFQNTGNNNNSFLLKNKYLLFMFFGGDYLTNVGEIYLCQICGNKVEVLENGPGVLVCCGEDMSIVE